jgi:hypothetical protein
MRTICVTAAVIGLLFAGCKQPEPTDTSTTEETTTDEGAVTSDTEPTEGP